MRFAIAAIALTLSPAVFAAELPDAPLPQPAVHARSLAQSPDNYTAAPGNDPNYVASQEHPPLTFASFTGNYIRHALSFRVLIDTGFVSGIPNLPGAPVQPQPPVGGFNATNCDYTLPDSQNACTIYDNAMSNYNTQITAWQDTSENRLRYIGRRAAVGAAASETRYFFGDLVLPLALREDPRYIPGSFRDGFGGRMLHAVDSIAITKTWKGHTTVNFAKLGSTAIAAYAAGSFYPREARAPELMNTHFMVKYGLYSLAGDAATNVARELVRTAVRKDLENFYRQGESTERHYYPLTINGKLASWLNDTYSPRHLVEGGLIAGIPGNLDTNVPDFPAQPVITTTQEEIAYENQVAVYATGVQAWRDNLENTVRYHIQRGLGGVAESETESALKYFLLPAMFNEEGRYIRESSEANFSARLVHPFVSILFTRTDSGHHGINIPELGGTAGAAFIAQGIIYPEMGLNRLSRSSVTAKTMEFNLAGDLLSNLVREFVPRRAF